MVAGILGHDMFQSILKEAVLNEYIFIGKLLWKENLFTHCVQYNPFSDATFCNIYFS